jgi:hypothetical protein
MDKPEPVPGYVLALLDAYLTGRPLNFGKHKVPAEVQHILSEAVTSGVLGTVRIEP